MTIRISIIVSLFILSLNFVAISQANPNEWPSIEGDGTLRRLHVPILMYHYISALPVDADDTRIGLTLDPVSFRQHIEYLDSAGYNTISLYEMNDALYRGTELPQNPVILSFDDGYVEHYQYVFPLLMEYEMTGTFFVISQFVDNAADGYMNWAQIEEMANEGMNIEAHTKNHADLRNRDYDFLVYEIVGSVESIEAHTGIRPRMFAYPVGRYDETTLNVIASTDILRAVTTQIGAWHSSTNAYELSRMRITNETSVSGLIYLLNYGK